MDYSMILILVVMVAVFYFMIIRPEKKKKKERENGTPNETGDSDEEVNFFLKINMVNN